jgi:cytoskeletal protein CcmA (bactofilin family)
MTMTLEAPMNNPKSPTLEKKTVIEEGTELRGSIVATCPIVVQGTVEGEVTGPSVEISATGRVAGQTKTDTLSSNGHVAGQVDVDVARLSGEVAPKTVIRASTLNMKLTHPSGKIELRFEPSGKGWSVS